MGYCQRDKSRHQYQAQCLTGIAVGVAVGGVIFGEFGGFDFFAVESLEWCAGGKLDAIVREWLDDDFMIMITSNINKAKTKSSQIPSFVVGILELHLNLLTRQFIAREYDRFEIRQRQ